MKFRIFLLLMFIFFLPHFAKSQERELAINQDTLNQDVILLKKYLSRGSDWHFTDPVVHKRLQSLISFIEMEPLDSLVKYLENTAIDTSFRYVFRMPENVSDSLSVAGYVSSEQAQQYLDGIRRNTEADFAGKQISVPADIFKNLEKEVELIPETEGMRLFLDGIYTLPDSLRALDAIPETEIQSTDDFKRVLRLEEERRHYIEQKRIRYNDSIVADYKNTEAQKYKQQQLNTQVEFLQQKFTDSVRIGNYRLLRHHNSLITKFVNDSIRHAIQFVSRYADSIDSLTVNLLNTTEGNTPLLLSNKGSDFTRVWIKNRQNDSLSVLVQNVDKRSMVLMIEDGVTFSHFRQKATKEFDFESLSNTSSTKLDQTGKRFERIVPWRLGTTANLSFTQTYLNNWAKGGKSAFTVLFTSNTWANYSLEKFKWNNSLDVRNGWTKQGKDMIIKNNDWLKLASSIGTKAFKKWDYSMGTSLETQFFNGYNYPNTDNPISKFLGPATFIFSIGLDYRPSGNFSLNIAPITGKAVFVIDTAKINQTNFGIPADKRIHWEPGINTNLFWNKTFKLKEQNINYVTKFNLFVNYLEPADRFKTEWENTITMRLTERINMQFILHFIYDRKVLFERKDKSGNSVLNENGAVIKEPKLQTREYISIGFAHTINRNPVKAKAIKK